VYHSIAFLQRPLAGWVLDDSRFTPHPLPSLTPRISAASRPWVGSRVFGRSWLCSAYSTTRRRSGASSLFTLISSVLSTSRNCLSMDHPAQAPSDRPLWYLYFRLSCPVRRFQGNCRFRRCQGWLRGAYFSITGEGRRSWL